MQPSMRARSTDPSTSHQAAANAGNFADSHCSRILSALGSLGSATAGEISRHTGLTVEQCCRRLVELQREGLARVLQGIDSKPITRDGFRVWAGF